MNIANIYKSKGFLIFLFIVLIVVFTFFMTLLFQYGYIGGRPQSITSEDESQISSIVKKSLSDTFTENELKLTNFRGDHNWAIALLYSPTETVDPGFVLMKNNGGNWELVYGPVTDPDPIELKKLGAPQSIIDQVDDVFVPAGIPQ